MIDLSYLAGGTLSLFSIKLVIHPSVYVVNWLKNFLILVKKLKSNPYEYFLELELFQFFSKCSFKSNSVNYTYIFLSYDIENLLFLVLITNLDNNFYADALSFGLGIKHASIIEINVLEYCGVYGIVYLREDTDDLL